MAQRIITKSKKCLILRILFYMTKFKLIFLLGFFFSSISYSYAYLLWLKSADNSIENIQKIEKTHNIKVPLVGFIFDPYGSHIKKLLDTLPATLWITRIYHITLSPNNYSAKEVADGKFDKQYKEIFQSIKDNNLKVVFRTMHEMNGGRYPWSSNPEMFRKAWIHVRKLSREIGLSTGNILFDFSINHRDMPTKETPSQKAKLIQCQLSKKQKLWCYTFEDYYPGNGYVDIIWFTFYNRWKWFADRRWLTPEDIVYEKWRNPLERIKKFNKPIIVDEVWTTAVWYNWAFNYKKSKEIYTTEYDNKNTRLRQLQQLLRKEQSIVGTVYFNVDYTKWLSQRLIGEADWSVINLETNKVYTTIFTLFNNSDNLHLWSPLLNLFGIGLIDIYWKESFIPKEYIPKINKILAIIKKGTKNNKEAKAILWEGLSKNIIRNIFPKISDKEHNEIQNILKDNIDF